MKLQLTGLKNQLPADATGWIKTCDGLLTYFDKVIDDIRNIAHGLMPSALEALGPYGCHPSDAPGIRNSGQF
jgi:signal transduction histidine kinase